MPRKTPHYKLIFNQSGDLYSASADLERTTIIDNQLYNLSRIVGDGVLEGWSISIDSGGGLRINVSPGSGFIGNVLHRTLSIKKSDVIDNATQSVYLQSNFLGTSTGFTVEAEGPFSSTASATFVDTTPPSAPTSFSGTSVDYDLINLFWDSNSESDFDHYEIDRDTSGAFPSPVSVASDLSLNGVFPNDPFQDGGLSSNTSYFYRIRAVDSSGNASSYSTIGPITTDFDTNVPGDPTRLKLFSGNGQISLSFDPSPTDDVVKYIITVQKLAADGTVASTLPEIDNGLLETAQVTGLSNDVTYSVRVQAVRSPDAIEIRSTGTTLTAVPTALPAPLSVTGLSATSGIGTITLSWTASTSLSGSAVGQKSKYFARIVPPGGSESAPINMGLSTSKVLNSFQETAVAGLGATRFFEDDSVYLIKVTAVDGFGNESGPAVVKATTLDVTAPQNPRSLASVAGDGAVALTWRHSRSQDVVDYELEIDAGSGFGAPTSVGYVEKFSATGLTNGAVTTFRVKAKDDAGNLSSGTSVVDTPQPDTVPPQVVTGIKVSPGDESVRLTWAAVPDEDLSYYVVERSSILQPLDTDPNFDLTILPGSTVQFNVGDSIEFIDIGLTNGQVYSYSIQSVDLKGNASELSARYLVAPNEGLNESGPDRIESPESVAATYAGGAITVTWDFDGFGTMFVGGEWVFTVNPSSAPTSFNIYRSTDSLTGFSLIDSVDSNVRSFVDENLLNGQTYYYRVTAVRDDAEILVDTGAVQPPNSVFLGTVTTDGGSISEIENSQRIAANIEGTLQEETLSRLLLHRHNVRAINVVETTALRAIGLIDINDLSSITLEGESSQVDLSADALSYFKSVDKNASGNAVTFDDNTVYIFDPRQLVSGIPFVGDYQLLVNGERPSGEFTIDLSNNSVVFSEPLADTDTVTVDGLGLTFYVPASLSDNIHAPDSTGFNVKVNGELASQALVDVALQTVRFLSPLAADDVVAVEQDADVQDFGTQEGGRQVLLSSRTDLGDFVRVNDRTFVSSSGIFDEGDSVFVLEVDSDGVATRTGRDHYVDFDQKAVIFSDPYPSDLSVALRLRNKEEVQGELPTERVGNVDASAFYQGQFTKPQLPDLSHEGLVEEPVFPVFAGVSSDNNYVYAGATGSVGTATTPYAISQSDSGEDLSYLLGTSRGMLRSVRGIFLGAGDDATIVDPLSATEIAPSATLAQVAEDAVATSGRTSGTIAIDPLKTVGGSPLASKEVSNPSLVELSDGRIVVVGGVISGEGTNFDESYVFDPSTGDFVLISLPSPSVAVEERALGEGAAIVLLPNGKALASGGDLLFDNGDAFSSAATHIFNPTLDSWTRLDPMNERRHAHSVQLLDATDPTSDVLAAGGVRRDTSIVSGALDQDLRNRPGTPLASAELFSQSSASWSSTGFMVEPSAEGSSFSENGKVIVDDFANRHIYDGSTGTWSITPPVLVRQSDLEFGQLDGPVKQFFTDSTGALLAVTRNSVFESRDQGVHFSKMKGLDATGAVHRISEEGGDLFAATDLGAYVIASQLRDNSTWFQSALIGAGTTEVFDLEPMGGSMVAATEIGVFSTDDGGGSWVQLGDMENVYNIELVGTDTLFAQAGQTLYRSDDAGANWSSVGTFSFLDQDSYMVARSPLHVFFGTSSGLFVTTNGSDFSLLPFDFNKDVRRNNVQMLALLGNDVYVGYDNALFAIGPDLKDRLVAEFSGIIPTVRVNGEEKRGGFRYDTTGDEITFEIKRISDDAVELTSNYALYQLPGGGWYEQSPNAPVTVFVDKFEQDSSSLSFDARLGQISFSVPRQKFESVSVSVANTTLTDEGEFFHTEVEDKLEQEKGLPLSLGRNHVANLLQMGLSIEHNFFERGIDRNQYYCLTGTLADRSFNSFWENSEFFIMGRRDFDSFNSTIEYSVESDQKDIGFRALTATSSLEVSATALWVGTDNGIFVLNPSSSFSVSKTISLSDLGPVAVRDMQFFSGNVLVATNGGLFSVSLDGTTTEENPGNNLPKSLFAVSSVNNVLAVGTDDSIYFSDSNDEPEYSVWFKASFVASLTSTEEIIVNGTCNCMVFKDGTIFAGIGSAVFVSSDGKVWSKAFEFPVTDDVVINNMTVFADMLFLGTNKGVYNDRGTSRSDTVKFEIELLESDEDTSKSIHINDMFPGDDTLYVAANAAFVYSRTNEAWSKEPLSVPSVHEIVELSSGRVAAIANNQVFVQ